MWKGLSSETQIDDLLGRQLSVRSHHVLAQLLKCRTVQDAARVTDPQLRDAGAGRVVLRDLNDVLASCGLPIKHWEGNPDEFRIPFAERSVDYLIADPDLRELLLGLGFATVRDLQSRPADLRKALEDASESWEDDCATIDRELKRIAVP
jgi:hypothetical protein